MDQGSLVEAQIDDGRRFVERFAADGNSVKAAFWVRVAEEDIWFLHVATDLADSVGPAAAYRAVHESLKKLGKSEVSSSEIKVVSPNNPIAKSVLMFMDLYPGRTSIWIGGQALGPTTADQVYVYIYPPRLFTFAQANPMTTEDVGREIVRLMSRAPGILPPSRITLKDGTSFNGVPFGLQLGSQKAVVAQFIADKEAAPRVIRLDEIASIA